MSSSANNIHQYIDGFPVAIKKLLNQVYSTIRKVAPGAKETMSYGMPTFKLNRNLVHFAAYKNHIGFYPSPSGIAAFKNRLTDFVYSKGAIQFPLDKPIPVKLISDITRFRVREETERLKMKSKRVCVNGHTFYKTSDCPTCPVCEKLRKPKSGFMSGLSAPARRALENKGITTLAKLSRMSELEILKLHGMGKASIPMLRSLLRDKGLKFKSD